MAATTTASRPPALRRKRSGGAGELSKKVWATSVMWLLAIVYGFPLLWFLLSSFKPPGELFSYPLTALPKNPTVSGYTKAWTTFDVGQYFLNTLIVAVSATVLTIVASAACGYALAKYKTWWLKAFTICILATTMLPGEVLLGALFLVVRDLGLYNSLSAVVIPAVITVTGTFMFRQFFITVPNDLLEAARIDGSSELSTFIRVMLPLSRPIMLTLGIFSFQWRWNDYIWPLVVLNDPNKFTLQIGVATIVGANNVNWSVLMGASILSMIPLVLIYLVFQKYVMNSDLSAGLKD
jgi:alpha-1,4-digalacturonate transport system permease protein